VISFAVNLNPGDDRRGDDASDALNGDPSLVPADHGEIKSWYLYDCASSPVAATVVTFWALLVTGYAKSRAASTSDVVEWREHYAGGRVCVGECVSSDADGATLESVACGAYDASVYGTTRKFERPEGVGGTCQWFPVDPSLPGSGPRFRRRAGVLQLRHAARVRRVPGVLRQPGGLFVVPKERLGDGMARVLDRAVSRGVRVARERR
jgi:hypothetical protein